MIPARAASLLALCAAFQGGAEHDIQALARWRSLRRGEYLFHQGEAAQELYLVETGLLRVGKLSAGGQRELTLHLSGPRQLPAGVSPFQAGATFSAGCTALEATSVLTLSAEEVRRITFHSPTLSASVIAYFARRHREVLERLDELLFTDLNTRLAQLLLGRAAAGPYPLPSNSELAAQLGTVPELISRKLGEFYRQGFIALERRSVTITNAAALRQMCAPRTA